MLHGIIVLVVKYIKKYAITATYICHSQTAENQNFFKRAKLIGRKRRYSFSWDNIVTKKAAANKD